MKKALFMSVAVLFVLSTMIAVAVDVSETDTHVKIKTAAHMGFKVKK